MKMSRKLVFFGTEDFSSYALRELLSDGWDIVAVVTKPDSRRGRGRHLQPSIVKQIAEKNSIDVLQPENLEGLELALEKYDCNAAVLSAYGKIIPPAVLDSFELGIINIHPSLLPRHRGASPIEQTILDGDDKTGVSLIRLVSEMDAGPVYAQKEFVLRGDETAPQLYESLGKLGAKLLIEQLPAIISGELQPSEQDESLATYAPMIKKSDGTIDWHQDAEVIERQVRAYLSWPGSKTEIRGKQVTITQARVSEESGKSGELFSSEKEFVVFCADKSIVIEKLKPAGKREMTSQEFLAGNQIL